MGGRLREFSRRDAGGHNVMITRRRDVGKKQVWDAGFEGKKRLGCGNSHHQSNGRLHPMSSTCYKCRKVTKPDFRRKIRIFFYKQIFKNSVFGHFLENAALVLPEISYLDSSH